MVRIRSKYVHFLIGTILFSILYSCVEPIEIKSNDFQSLLVVEGIITNELKNQKILLSRSYPIEENGALPVSNAKVFVEDSEGHSYDFNEDSPGVYMSKNPFEIAMDVKYRLHVETSNGVYESSLESINSSTEISQVKSSEVVVEDQNGVAITVSNMAENGHTSYYKFDYIETYEIRSPYKKYYDIIINENGEPEVVPKEEQDYICYVTKPSTEIILSNTSNLSENNISNFLIRFLSVNDYELAYRYSILVKQYKISSGSYLYYNTLQNISKSESLFSQYQPGFIEGNISKLSEENEKVIGYFSVASVDTARTFFSYSDYFDPNNPRPSHTGSCDEFVPARSDLKSFIESGHYRFFQEDPVNVYHLIRASCVDCRLFGENEPPAFWTEE